MCVSVIHPSITLFQAMWPITNNKTMIEKTEMAQDRKTQENTEKAIECLGITVSFSGCVLQKVLEHLSLFVQFPGVSRAFISAVNIMH